MHLLLPKNPGKESQISVLQDEVEKNYAIINDKFSTAVSNKKKSAIWNKISMMVSALGVAHRSAKECRDKWGNTKKEAKKVFSVTKKTMPELGYEDKTRDITEDDRDELTRYLCTFKEINLTIPDIPSMLHDTIAFILQNSKKTVDNSAALPEESATNSQDLLMMFMSYR
ncbi:unnamed protein product [Mytilus coruscus]|uniref:Myb/SANT-like DNA-binding domain-containing protein n=1 Tax=Mytilus coruscus TaxID=42192 RepID=A0A6J8AKF8_MYTCO|nr:unnamed protein product [Mytilus coruscus]